MTGSVAATSVVDSPVGPIGLVARDGALAELKFLAAAGFPDGDRAPAAGRDAAVLADAARQLAAYFAGELTDFDLPLAPAGTGFQLAVWKLLQEIPYGETTSYGALARRLGQPTAARAVGLANGANPIGVIVPCHRVIGSGGRLIGYAGGLDRKRFLLQLEERVSGRSLL